MARKARRDRRRERPKGRFPERQGRSGALGEGLGAFRDDSAPALSPSHPLRRALTSITNNVATLRISRAKRVTIRQPRLTPPKGVGRGALGFRTRLGFFFPKRESFIHLVKARRAWDALFFQAQQTEQAICFEDFFLLLLSLRPAEPTFGVAWTKAH